MTSTPEEQRPTEKFGRYELLRKIGQGGMAEVFLANDLEAPPNSRPVVIKRLHADLEKDEQAVDLFLTEADVTLLLSHPNVIHVFDASEVHGRYYIAMEYVHGKDLEQIYGRVVSKGQALEPTLAVHIMSKVLRGLHYVHTAKTASGRDLGLVHRDVTPSNVYVSSLGGIKLGDFGVAKLMGVEGWTMAGSMKGKLGYLSPEQVAAEPPDQSIDLWAAAIILWELLAGTRAFSGEHELEIMLRIKAAKVLKVRKVNKAVPRSLQKILKIALHKKQRKRYQTAADFADALVEFMEKENVSYNEETLVAALTRALT